MKNSKQIREIAVLCTAIAVLVIIAIFSLKGTGTTQPPSKPRIAKAEQSELAAAKKPASRTAEWVDDKRLERIANEVKGGRNPFKNLAPVAVATAKTISHGPTESEPMPVQYVGGQLPGLAELPVVIQRTVTLQWISRQQLQDKIIPDYPGIQVGPEKISGQVTLTGPKYEIEEMVALLPSIDLEPPVPPFILVGIITMREQRCAIISLDGTTYNLNTGDAIPTVGWIVTGITPTGVTLTKEKQSRSLRLAGGKA